MNSDASETASCDDIECRLYDGSISIMTQCFSKGHMISDKKSSRGVAKMTMPNDAELPVHASIVHGAPVKLIKTLITDDPSSLQTQDDNGRVPLHLAFRRGDEGIILELLSACPESFYIKDNDGKMPIQSKFVEDDDDVDILLHHEDDDFASSPTITNSKILGENPSLTPTFSQNEKAMTKPDIPYSSDSGMNGNTNKHDQQPSEANLENRKNSHLLQSNHEASLHMMEEYNRVIDSLHHQIKVLNDKNKMLVAREIDSNKKFSEKEKNLKLKMKEFEEKLDRQEIEHGKVLEKIEEVIDETEVLDSEGAEGKTSRPTKVLEKLDFIKKGYKKIIAREKNLQTKLRVADELNAAKTVIDFTRKLASLEEDRQDALNKISFLEDENKAIAKQQQKIDSLNHELDLKEKHVENFGKIAEEYAEKVALLEQENAENTSKLSSSLEKFSTFEKDSNEKIVNLVNETAELKSTIERNKITETSLKERINELQQLQEETNKNLVDHIEENKVIRDLRLEIKKLNNKLISKEKDYETAIEKFSYFIEKNVKFWDEYNENKISSSKEMNKLHLVKISALENENASQNTRHNELIREHGITLEKISVLEDKCQVLKSRVNELENSLASKDSKALERVSHLENDIKAAWEVKLKASEDKISALENETKRKTEELETERKNALEKITLLENEIEALQTNHTAVNNELTALKKEEISLSNKISSLSEELELRPSIEQLEEISTKLVSTEQAHSKALDEINTIEGEKKGMHEKIILIEEGLVNAMDEITALEKKNKEITDKMAILEEENKLLPELRTKICELNANNISKEKELSKFKRELGALPSKAIIQELAVVKKYEESLLIIEKLEKERSVIPEMEKEVEGLKTELNERDDRLSSLNEITTTLETTLDELTSKLKNIEDELMRKEEELNILKNKTKSVSTPFKLNNIIKPKMLNLQSSSQKFRSLITKNDCLNERHNLALNEFSSITKKNKTFVSSLQYKLSSIETERNITLEKITSIESQTEEEKAVLKKEIETLYKRLTDMEMQADDIRSESVSLEKKAQESFALEFKVNELTEELSMTKRELEHMTENVHSLKKTNEKLKQTLDEVSQSHIELMRSRDIWKTKAEDMKIEKDKRRDLIKRLL